MGGTEDRAFGFGEGVVRVAAAGLVWAVTAGPAGASYLDSAGAVEVLMSGSATRWAPTQQAVDVDELELRGPLAATGLELTVRHTFATSWSVRLALYNPTSAALAVESVTLTWVPAPDCPVRVLTAGADGAYAILPRRAQGPVLAGLLTQGELARITAGGITAGPLLLPSGGRYVFAWSWEWYATPALVDRHRRGSVPRRLAVTTSESVRIAADADAAVVAPGLSLLEERGELELSSAEPGTFPVAVSAARGTSRYLLQVVPPLEDLLTDSARRLVAGPRTSAGVVRLDGAAAGLVLQRALASADFADRDEAEDALDALTARLRERPPGDPVAAVYLCAESARTGDAGLRELAAGLAQASGPPRPGHGLLVAQLNLARLIAAEPPLTVAAPGSVASAQPGVGTDTPPDAHTAATLLELGIFGVAPGASGAPVDPAAAARLTGWARLVAYSLGAGVTGLPLHPMPLEEQAYRAVVLGLSPEEVGRPLRRTLGCTLPQLAAWNIAEVSARLVDQPVGSVGAAHAWLALSSGLG